MKMLSTHTSVKSVANVSECCANVREFYLYMVSRHCSPASVRKVFTTVKTNSKHVGLVH